MSEARAGWAWGAAETTLRSSAWKVKTRHAELLNAKTIAKQNNIALEREEFSIELQERRGDSGRAKTSIPWLERV